MNILLTSPSMSMAIVALVETCILPLSEKNHPFFLCMQPLFYAKNKTTTQHVGKAALLLNMSVTPTSTALTPPGRSSSLGAVDKLSTCFGLSKKFPKLLQGFFGTWLGLSFSAGHQANDIGNSTLQVRMWPRFWCAPPWMLIGYLCILLTSKHAVIIFNIKTSCGVLRLRWYHLYLHQDIIDLIFETTYLNAYNAVLSLLSKQALSSPTNALTIAQIVESWKSLEIICSVRVRSLFPPDFFQSMINCENIKFMLIFINFQASYVFWSSHEL